MSGKIFSNDWKNKGPFFQTLEPVLLRPAFRVNSCDSWSVFSDPNIQSPDNLQSFNRYSYVWNNPLTKTDPSGSYTVSMGGSAPAEVAKTLVEQILPAYLAQLDNTPGVSKDQDVNVDVDTEYWEDEEGNSYTTTTITISTEGAESQTVVATGEATNAQLEDLEEYGIGESSGTGPESGSKVDPAGSNNPGAPPSSYDPFGACKEKTGAGEIQDHFRDQYGPVLGGLANLYFKAASHGFETYQNAKQSGISERSARMLGGAQAGGEAAFLGGTLQLGNMAAGQALGRASALMQAAPAAKNVQMSSGERVFWSGSPEARQAAESFARSSGGRTLEMTWPGKILDSITTERTYPVLKPFWDQASKTFASGANGSVDVFQSSAGVRLNSVWTTIEYPQLINSGIPINYHITP